MRCYMPALDDAGDKQSAQRLGQCPSLLDTCVAKLAQVLIRYGPKKVRFALLSDLPHGILEALIDTLVAKNALNDNILLHALTRRTEKLGLAGAFQVRRHFLNTVGRACPSLQVLDVRGCHQVDNRIVRDVLQYCEHLSILRLDGCTKISDSAFAPALWKPPLVGLLGLLELTVARCGQITAEGLLCSVMKGTPILRRLGLENCRSAVTDEVAAELLFSFGLETLDLSHCSQITDAPFVARSSTTLRELRLSSTGISDAAIEGIAERAPQLLIVDVGGVLRFGDSGLVALTRHCKLLQELCLSYTQITDAAFDAMVTCRHLQRLDVSWCLKPTAGALEVLALPFSRPPLREFLFDNLGALNLGASGTGFSMLPPALSREGMSGKAGLRSPALMPGLAPASPLRSVRSIPCEAPSWNLPAAAVSTDRPSSNCRILEMLPPASCPPLGGGGGASGSNPNSPQRTFEALPSLQLLAAAYAQQVEVLLLEGMHDVVNAAALEMVASSCPNLQQLALTLRGSASDKDAALPAAFKSISAKCPWLWMLRLDSSSHPHHSIIPALALPHFGRMQSLSLACCSKAGGLSDSQLETILNGRKTLQSLSLRGCDGLSEGLFPSWSPRHERQEGPVAIDELNQALLNWEPDKLTSVAPGPFDSPWLQPMPEPKLLAAVGGTAPEVRPVTTNTTAQPRQGRSRVPRGPAAEALRTIRDLSLTGAGSLTDESGAALADLLREVQTIDLRGCPFLSEETLKSFQKLCRLLRSVSIATRDRSLTWSAASKEKKRHNRRPTWAHSESSATESN
mmetsp:Transcript_55292/g.131872  ORF Transcript_55292/g.131872 Transcript_55292/m.131872 type:complete len:797 (+) Transcript_55292:146-2536(+)